MVKKSAISIPPIINGDYEMVPTESLKCHPRNIRQGDLGEIIESMRHNGFYGTLTVQRSTRHVLAGNHRLMAAAELRIPAVPVVWIDCTDDAALRIMLVDNASNDKATNNEAALAELLAELAATPNELLGTGYDGDALDQLISDLANAPAVDTISPEAARKTLAERFIVPPFSVLDARQGYWQERKRAWIALGIRSELGRGGSAGDKLTMSATIQELKPSADQSAKRGGVHKSTPGHGPTVRQNPDGTLNYNPPMPKYIRHA